MVCWFTGFIIRKFPSTVSGGYSAGAVLLAAGYRNWGCFPFAKAGMTQDVETLAKGAGLIFCWSLWKEKISLEREIRPALDRVRNRPVSWRQQKRGKKTAITGWQGKWQDRQDCPKRNHQHAEHSPGAWTGSGFWLKPWQFRGSVRWGEHSEESWKKSNYRMIAW